MNGLILMLPRLDYTHNLVRVWPMCIWLSSWALRVILGTETKETRQKD